MHAFDSERWSAANWSDRGMVLNACHPSQLSFAEGRMAISLEALVDGDSGRPAFSAELRSKVRYHCGWYTARFKASGTPDTVSAFFTYTGPSDGSPHNEIDVEVKGDDPTQLQVNYWTDGVEHQVVVDLGFDASQAVHEYGFHWTATAIRWYVDGKLVHEGTGRRGELPTTAQRIMLNHWGTTGDLPWVQTTTSSPLRGP